MKKKVLSPQYIALKNLEPRETVWSSGGRPIHDRLPAAEGRYRKRFLEDPTQGYVFIPRNSGSSAPDSLLVTVSQDRKVVLLTGGTTVWEHGSASHDPVLIDLRRMGMGSAKYTLVYQMTFSSDPVEIYTDVSDTRLSGKEFTISSSSDDIVGWIHSPDNAFSYDSTLLWKNQDARFSSQPAEAWLQWEHSRDLFATEIRVFMDGVTTNEGCELFLNDEYLATPTYDASTNSFSFYLDRVTIGSKWKIQWEQLDVAVREIRFTGKLPDTYDPLVPVMRINLAAYPLDQLPSGYIYCKLASFDVDDNYQVVGPIQDLRDLIYSDNQQIAKWLTNPFDATLQTYYQEHTNFVKNRMNPVTMLLG